MRPVLLTLTGFTCFREPTTIDFRDLRVFGVSGATGSGKTSILDAMTFALYGRVPRMGKSCGPLISLGKDRMSVSFEFTVGSRAYTVARALRRGGGSQAQLDDGTSGVLVAEGIREVDRHVEQLLGMPFETFTQAVVLPQGDFARFLASSPSERTKILRELLRLDIYDRMRRRAVEREKRAQQTATVLAEQLKKHFAHATEARVTSLREALVAQREERVVLSETARQRREHAAELRIRRARTEALEAARTKHLALEQERTNVKQDREELRRALEADTFRADLQRLETAEVTATERAKDTEVARARTATAARDRQGVARELERALEDSRALPQIAERIVALDRISGDVEALARDLAEEASAKRRLETEEAARVRAATVFEEAGLTERQARTAEEAASRVVEEMEPSLSLLARLEDVADLARRGISARELAVAKGGELERVEARLRAAEEAERNESEALAASEAALTKAEKALEAARSASAKASHVDHVRKLRGELSIGEPCPVCEQKVDAKPRLPRSLDIDAPLAKERAAEESARAARDAVLRLRADIEHARVLAMDLRRSVEAMRAEASTVLTEHEGLAKSLADRLAPLPKELDAGASSDTRVVATLDALRPKRRAADAARSDLDAASRAFRAAGSEVARARHELERFRERTESAKTAARGIEARVLASRARIAGVTSHPDPSRERTDLALDRDRLEAALSAAKHRDRDAETRELHATAELAHAERELTSALCRKSVALASLEGGFSGSGFTSVSEVRAASRPEARRAELRSKVDRFDRSLGVAEEAVALATEALGGAPVSASELASALRTSEEAHAAVEAATKSVGAREQELAAAQTELGRALEVSADLARAEKERATYTELAADLGTAEFQQHVQASVVAELVEQASLRLSRLSRDRYRLTMRDDDFWVIDEENAGAPRPASTLSGGETFLASLALALSLSDQVQAASGAVRLESLFIDEGFGTLDLEALDVAAEAVESLEEGGRMVGIISHVRELNQRVRRELVVERGPKGSTIRSTP